MIQLLSDSLINQIAAGEVVERPASVVKELVENAMDAGASRITVEILQGGLSLIRVSDNGCGMAPEDAQRAVLRHATSKISSLEDLSAVRTLGFRGEALPSIASVSRFELVTRPADLDHGVKVQVVDGTVTLSPVASPQGTSLTVEDLFYNVPARLKFQKSERSQVSAIREILERAAISRPDVHIILRVQDRVPMDFPPVSNLLDRVSSVFGTDIAPQLIPFEKTRESRVCGVLGSPTIARPTSSRLLFVVNSRPVSDPALRRAAINAYSTLLPQGRFPLAVICIECDPSEVDVNVHPQKTEVRFRNHQQLAGLVFTAMRDEIAKTAWLNPSFSDPINPEPTSTFPWPLETTDRIAEPGRLFDSPPSSPSAPIQQPLFSQDKAPTFASLQYVGQIHSTILVLQSRDAVFFIDQHAVHERIHFQRLWAALSSGDIPPFPLLLPQVIHLTPTEAGVVEEAIPLLGKVGFDIEIYSGDSVAIRAIPAILQDRSLEPILREMLASLGEQGQGTGTQRLEKIVSTIACHASVRAQDQLQEDQVRSLLEAMDSVDFASYCPHGRQAVVTYPISTVLRWFGR